MQNAEGLIQQKLVEAYKGFILLVPNIFAGFVMFGMFLVAAWIAERGIKRGFHARGQYDLGTLLGGFSRWGIIGFGLLIAVTIVVPSVKPSDALATLGIGSVAIGFAFKDILQNWFAGLLILLRQPFGRGDQIVAGGFEGTVEMIHSRATVLKTYDGKRVVIPNSDIYTQPVTVNTAFQRSRSYYDVGIGYGDDIETARDAILEGLDGLAGIARDPAPEVIPWDLAGSSVNLRVRWWTGSTRAEVVLARGRVIAAIHGALAAAQIDMPYPTQVMLFHDQTETTDGDRTRQREGWPAGRNPPEPRNRRSGDARRPRPDQPRNDAISSEGEL